MEKIKSLQGDTEEFSSVHTSVEVKLTKIKMLSKNGKKKLN